MQAKPTLYLNYPAIYIRYRLENAIYTFTLMNKLSFINFLYCCL